MAVRRLIHINHIVVLTLGMFSAVPESAQAANILGFFALSGASHNNVFTALTKELASRGHHLTVVTPHPLKTLPSNYEQIDVSRAILKHFTGFDKVNVIGAVEIFSKILNMTTSSCRDTLQLPEIQNLMDSKKSGKTFDLILASHFFSECFLGFSHIYDAPVILISPSGAFPHTDSLVGNVALPSYVPNTFFAFSDRMTFLQRTVNFLSYVAMNSFANFVMYPSHEKIMKEFFGDFVPSIPELQRRISMIFLNNHFTYNYPRPSVPTIVEVGGMHVKKPNPLPKELKDFMDGAKDGVVYFSMGSNLKTIYFPENVRNMFVNVFSQLKQKVLWKWEADEPMPGKPDNIRLEKWLPQTDLLAHPNMKLFITHGGLLSFQEAVHRGVPVIGIPCFGDQDLNMEKVIKLGVGIKVSYNEITKEGLQDAVHQILSNPSYGIKMKELSAKVKDQPQTPLERAAYWTEYVIRHKGAKHLQSAALDLAWCQIYMLDVISVLIAVPTIILLALYYVISRCCCRRRDGSKNATGKSKAAKSKTH